MLSRTPSFLHERRVALPCWNEFSSSDRGILKIFRFLDVQELGVLCVNHFWLRLVNEAKIQKLLDWLNCQRSIINDIQISSFGTCVTACTPTIRCARMKNILGVLEVHIKGYSARILKILAELIATNHYLRKIREKALTEGRMLMCSFSSLAVFFQHIVAQIQHLVTIKKTFFEFAEIPDTDVETRFKTHLTELLWHRPRDLPLTESYKSLTTDGVHAITLVLTKVIHATNDDGLGILAKEVAKRLESFFTSEEYFQRKNDKILKESVLLDVLKGWEASSRRRSFGFSEHCRINVGTHKESVENLLLNPEKRDHIPATESVLDRIKYHKVVCELEDQVPNLLEEAVEDILRANRKAVLVSQELERIHPKQKIDKQLIKTKEGTPIFQGSREVLEEYAELHRNDHPMARGTLSAYIKQKYWPDEEFPVRIQVDCSGLDLSGINFFDADLAGTMFVGANLSFASLYRANLTGCSFRDANLSYCMLQGAIIEDAVFANTDLRGVDANLIHEAQTCKRNCWELRKVKELQYCLKQIEATEKVLREEPLDIGDNRALFLKLGLAYGLRNEVPDESPLSPENMERSITTIDYIPVCTYPDELISEQFPILMATYDRNDHLDTLVETAGNALNHITDLLNDATFAHEPEVILRWKTLRKEISTKLIKADFEKLVEEIKTSPQHSRTSLVRRFLEGYTRNMNTHNPDWDGEYILDMRGIDFLKLELKGLNLSGTQFDTKQLIHAFGMTQVTGLTSKELINSVRQEKFQYALHLIHVAQTTIDTCVTFILESCQLNTISSSGEPPKLDQLSDTQIRVVSYLALTSFIINRLDSSHPLYFVKVTEELDTTKSLSTDVEEMKNKLLQVLSARKNQLNREVTAMVYSSKLAIFYNAVADTFIDIVDVDRYVHDLLPENQKIVLQKLDELKKNRRRVLDGEKQDLNRAYQLYVDALIQDLRAPPDEYYDADNADPPPIRRIREALSFSRDGIVVDLSKCDLSGIDITGIDFTKCSVKFSHDQLERDLSKEQGQERIHQFKLIIKEGDIDKVRLFLNQGVSLNLPALDGRTPLMDACWNDYYDIARLLLENGAKVNARTTETNFNIIEVLARLDLRTERERRQQLIELLVFYGGKLDFHSAVALGDLDTVMKFVQESPGIVHRSSHGEGPLHLAVRYGHIAIVAYLLGLSDERGRESSPDPNLPNIEGLVPLQTACLHGHLQIAQMLISYNTNINMTDRQGRTLIFLSAQGGYHLLADLLIRYGAKLDVHSAVLLGRIPVLEQYVAGVKNINHKFVKGKTILHLAIEANHLEVVRWVLIQGASLDETTGMNQTPLMLACKKGYADIVNLLLLFKNNISDKIHKEEPPLWIAVSYGHVEVVKILLEKGSDTNFKYLGRTCLHEAIRKNGLEIVNLLIKAGASIFVLDGVQNTPLHVAAAKGNEAIIRMLLHAYLAVKNNDNMMPVDLLPQSCSGELRRWLSVNNE